jgi:hypothetical protein
MRPTNELFVLLQKVRDGTLSRPDFVEQMQPIRAEVESLLLRGYFDARVWLLQRFVGASAEPVDLCGGGGSRADEQCRGAGVASGGDLAEVVVWYEVVNGEPVC